MMAFSPMVHRSASVSAARLGTASSRVARGSGSARLLSEPRRGKDGDIVWIGNWGDEERTEELREYLMRPGQGSELRAKVHGVRYPDYALDELREPALQYGGWIANFEVPELCAVTGPPCMFRAGPYVEQLKGIPTIRPFEALACGIPLISSYWHDSEDLFRPGQDFSWRGTVQRCSRICPMS